MRFFFFSGASYVTISNFLGVNKAESHNVTRIAALGESHNVTRRAALGESLIKRSSPRAKDTPRICCCGVSAIVAAECSDRGYGKVAPALSF